MTEKNPRTDLVAERRAKLAQLREQGFAYPNDFHPDTNIEALVGPYEGLDADAQGEFCPRR